MHSTSDLWQALRAPSGYRPRRGGEQRKENWNRLQVPETALTALNQLPAARTGDGRNPFKAPDNVFAFQQKCDAAATRSAPGVRRVTVSTVMLHVLATFIAAAAVSWSIHSATLAWAKFACLGWALPRPWRSGGECTRNAAG